MKHSFSSLLVTVKSGGLDGLFFWFVVVVVVFNHGKGSLRLLPQEAPMAAIVLTGLAFLLGWLAALEGWLCPTLRGEGTAKFFLWRVAPPALCMSSLGQAVTELGATFSLRLPLLLTGYSSELYDLCHSLVRAL